MIYELFLEGELADIRQDLGMQLSFNIDDINKYGSRDTSFSKTIVLPGTAKNNKLLGFVGELGSSNLYELGAENINANFNPAQTTKAELRANGLLLLKGVFRLTGIVKDRDMIEYEGNLFGELGGFIAQISGGKLEHLDFSDYDHTYTRDNIVNSWNTINGSGYYYPLIDYGRYSTNKIDYDYRTFRPALFVKEYMDKIFAGSGYTYESEFLNSNFFKSLIIPQNIKEFVKLDKQQLSATKFLASGTDGGLINFDSYVGANFSSSNSNSRFSYIGVSEAAFNGNLKINGTYSLSPFGALSVIRIIWGDLDNNIVQGSENFYFASGTNRPINIDFNFEGVLGSGFEIYVQQFIPNMVFTNTSFNLKIDSKIAIPTFITLNDQIEVNNYIPKGIMQKDFFSWILKMFNLYVTEDKLKEKHLLIEPYVDYYNLEDQIDWTYKVARDKPWQIKPMGMLNGRFFEYKYKDDNDFYNESYRKKFNLPYGSNLQDTYFQFAKEKQSIEIGFSPSVLVQYDGTDKVLTSIYKLTKGSSLEQEEWIDSNIRIMLAKKITEVGSWSIINKGVNLDQNPGTALGAALTAYGYAGHFDDPVNPTKDINFGAASEIYFDPNVYPTNNLFNDYWSGYIAEIADKDSKLLTCHVYLNDLDIAQLDFSKPVFIDGVLWRINKIIDFDAASGELTKVELLKVINNG
jgi:hypothetical protein